jgi:autophagy-related protein 18
MRYNNVGEGIGKIEMLYCTSLLTLVGSGEQPGSSPRKFRLWNSQNKVPFSFSPLLLRLTPLRCDQEIICELSFPSTILNIKLNRERVIICLETQIHVYELSSMKCLQVLSIASNPYGLLALSSENSSYLAFPSGSAGGVVLYDCLSLRLLSQIDAHKNNVVSMTFNRSIPPPLLSPHPCSASEQSLPPHHRVGQWFVSSRSHLVLIFAHSGGVPDPQTFIA